MKMFDSRTKMVQNAPIVRLRSEVSVSEDLISLGQGIPFFSPPDSVIKAVKDGCKTDISYQYTVDEGLISLREKIAEKMRFEQNISIDSSRNIVVTAGANQAFMNAILSITQPGDEIIFFQPTYFNYVMAVQLAGCKPIFCRTDSNFLPIVDEIKEKINDRTKAIVTISPNNPTGAVYPEFIAKEINELCVHHDLFHISDEVYEYFLYDGTSHVSPLRFDTTLDHSIGLYSFSKAFGMSGFRVGYMVIPDLIFDDVLKVQDTIGICASSISQIAAEQAVTLGKSYVSRFAMEYDENRRLLQSVLNKQEMIQMTLTKGAYYVLVSYQSTISSWELAKKLIEEYKVMVLPGSIFDAEYTLRISYGNIIGESFQKALHRLIRGLDELL